MNTKTQQQELEQTVVEQRQLLCLGCQRPLDVVRKMAPLSVGDRQRAPCPERRLALPMVGWSPSLTCPEFANASFRRTSTTAA